MYRILLLLMLFCLGKTLSAQHVYTIKADSVKITNSCDTAELILENHTQNVSGFLFNKGKGRTEFRKGLVKLNDTVYRIGADSLKIPKPPVYTASNGLSMVGNSVQLGFGNGQTNSADALFTGNRIIPLNGNELRIDNGTLSLTNGITGSSRGKLLDLVSSWNTTSNPTALGITVVNQASNMGNLLAMNLYGSNGGNSSFLVRAIGSRQYMNFYDYMQGTAYLGIGPNNLVPGYNEYEYNWGILNLNGSYSPSEGTNTVCGISDGSMYSPTGGSLNSVCYRMTPFLTTAAPANTKLRGIFYSLTFNGSGSIPNNDHIAFENRNGNVLLNNQYGDAGGRTAIHLYYGYDPTAWLHLGAGMNIPKGAPLKFTAGVVLDVPEEGAVEYDGADLYLTTASVRYKLSKTLTGQLTTNFNGPPLGPYNSITTTLSVTGAQAGDVVTVSANAGTVNPPSLIITAYVTSANTVTLRAYNAGNSSVTIASDTYKVRVIK